MFQPRIALFPLVLFLAVAPGMAQTSNAPQFGLPTDYSIPSTQSVSNVLIKAVDLNQDGKLDLVVISSLQVVSVFLNDGTGKFLNRIDSNFGAQIAFPMSVAIGDFNSDGVLDLAAVSYSGTSAQVMTGDGKGHFLNFGTVTFGAPPFDRCLGPIGAADVNRDGAPDLVVANCLNQSISVFLGTGNGAFGSAINSAVPNGGVSSNASSLMIFGDFNNDGIPDAVVGIAKGFGILLGRGDGTFTGSYLPTSPGAPITVTAADVNRDGNLDLVSVPSDPSVPAQPPYTSAGNNVVVWLGDGKGGFTPLPQFPALLPNISTNGGTPLDLEVSDVNGDGIPDIAISKSQFQGFRQISGLLTFTGNGDGTFTGPYQFFSTLDLNGCTASLNCSRLQLSNLVLADFNGDRKPDLAFYDTDAPSIGVASNTTSSRLGVLSHLVSGAGWQTSIGLVNDGTALTNVTVVLHADDGSALSLPVVTTQQGTVQAVTASSVNLAIAPNATALVQTTLPNGPMLTGWAEVLGFGDVHGIAIDQYAGSSGLTIPFQQAYPPIQQLEYDNTNGTVTGIAIANLSTAPNTCSVTVWDINGVQLLTQTLTLPAGGHTSFLMPAQFPLAGGQRGLLQFQSSSPFAIIGVEATPTGSLISVPPFVP